MPKSIRFQFTMSQRNPSKNSILTTPHIHSIWSSRRHLDYLSLPISLTNGQQSMSILPSFPDTADQHPSNTQSSTAITIPGYPYRPSPHKVSTGESFLHNLFQSPSMKLKDWPPFATVSVSVRQKCCSNASRSAGTFIRNH